MASLAAGATGFRPAALLLVAIAGLVGSGRADEAIVAIGAEPASVRLEGPGAQALVLVHGKTSDGRLVDLTHEARRTVRDAAVARIGEAGVVRSVGDGETTAVFEAAGKSLEVAISVRAAGAPRRFHFENDVVPILSKLGCNASGCHGKAEGQNGFKLSVFGFDPAADHSALTRESRGRRVFPAAPEQSLLLRKITGALPHGGGVRTTTRSAEYETLRGWIEAGMPVGPASDPKVVAIRLEPRERPLAMGARQQLRVVARYSDGHEVDVTRHSKYQANQEGLASVDERGLVTAGKVPGEVAVMATYMGAVDVFQALIPRAGRLDATDWPENNAIDTLVFRKLRTLNVAPSGLASDAEFLRRVYLDVIGTLPTPDEARRFFDDHRPDHRARLVDELLARPEYADYWALKWCDLLRVDRAALGHKRAYAFYRWIRDSLAANVPFDDFARAIVTAEGPVDESGPAPFYNVAAKPGDAASTLSQVFLGVRIACAECHHHPYDRWGQDDYFGMLAYFAPVGIRATARGEAVVSAGVAEARHPRTQARIVAHALGTLSSSQIAKGDARPALADWMTAVDNPWFARNLANRLWAHFLGRGLVDPVDDVRATNPPSNPELLDGLARYLVEHRYDTKALIRWITASRVYQLSSAPNPTNVDDERNASRALLRRIDAEVLYDMVCQTTGVGEKFAGVPAGARAIELWDSKVPHEFLRMFGRPVRASACECERVVEPSVGQVLHLLNAPELQAKLTHDAGTVARLERRLRDDGSLTDELFLTFFSRVPSAEERSAAAAYLRDHAPGRRRAAEDLAWGLMNSLEFLFNH
jgi:hypothetical protein